jgi:hypothetical protein
MAVLFQIPKEKTITYVLSHILFYLFLIALLITLDYVCDCLKQGSGLTIVIMS